MRKPSTKKAQAVHAPSKGPEDRARELLLRLETGGPNPVQAAEELDRLQAALGRIERLEGIRQRIEALCDAWSGTPLRGDRGRAWLSLVGAFDLKEHVDRAAEIAQDSGLPGPLRIDALRVLPRLGGEDAVRAVQAVLLSNTEPQVRARAAEALAEIGDRSMYPVLEALLEEDLPRTVWNAVSAAADRLR